MAESSLHVVLFPWLAFGHLIPFLELSKSLAKRCHHVYFLSTPRNISRLPKLPPSLAPSIDFVPIPLPPCEGLPDGAEATSDLPQEKVKYLNKAFDGLEQSVAEFLVQTSPKPSWIIHDYAPYWLPLIAARVGVPCIFFNTFPSFVSAFFTGPGGRGMQRPVEAFTTPPEWIPFPTKLAYRAHEARSLSDHVKRDDVSGVSLVRRIEMVGKGCELMAVRACTEFEREWLSLLREHNEKPVIPVGLLPPSIKDRSGEANQGANTGDIFLWLRDQAPGSVLYIALGSEVALSAELLRELAFGLEQGGLPFLWALRRPDDMEALPEGFEERLKGRGVVAFGWIPQLQVLAHESVGGFLTHCGWGSLIEGLAFGRPLVLLPIAFDQGLNARLMEEKSLGVEIGRDEEDGSFTREAVAHAIGLVMVEEAGKKIRDAAKEMKDVFGDTECHEKYVDEFVQYLQHHNN